MVEKEMRVEIVDINSLKPHPGNPRIHPESAIEKLKKSIEEYGWTNPILVSADGYILAGHARTKAAKELGLSQLPVIYLSLEGAEAIAYMIADNRLAEETSWDYDMLAQGFERLIDSGIALKFTGFSEEELEGICQDIDFDALILDEGEDGIDEIAEDTLTTCPYCGYEF